MEIFWNHTLEIPRRWGILSEDPSMVRLGLFSGITHCDKRYFLGKGAFEYSHWSIAFNPTSHKTNRDYLLFREHDFFTSSSMNSFYNKLCENM